MFYTTLTKCYKQEHLKNKKKYHEKKISLKNEENKKYTRAFRIS